MGGKPLETAVLGPRRFLAHRRRGASGPDRRGPLRHVRRHRRHPARRPPRLVLLGRHVPRQGRPAGPQPPDRLQVADGGRDAGGGGRAPEEQQGHMSAGPSPRGRGNRRSCSRAPTPSGSLGAHATGACSTRSTGPWPRTPAGVDCCSGAMRTSADRRCAGQAVRGSGMADEKVDHDYSGRPVRPISELDSESGEYERAGPPSRSPGTAGKPSRSAVSGTSPTPPASRSATSRSTASRS